MTQGEHRFVTGPLVDHHCHGLMLRDLDRAGFEGLLNEASGPSPLGGSVFDSMLGLAVRRWCSPVLDLDPLADASDYLARRNELGADEVARRFLASAAVSDFVVDTGYVPEPVTTLEELAGLAGGRSYEVVRLEALAEATLADGVPPNGLMEAVEEALATTTAVGAKSIAAYRVGLDLPATKPSETQLVEAVSSMQADARGTVRLAHPMVNGFLAWAAIEAGLPLQVHVGYGDNDVNLRDCDPLLLTGFLRATQERGVPVMLLHNYPFHRSAGYLAQVFDHVFMDVGLAVHNTGALSRHVIAESLELVPFTKMLYSSDAFGLPELYHLGSLLFRRGLSRVLEELVDDGEMATADAARLADLVGHVNAVRAYRLDER